MAIVALGATLRYPEMSMKGTGAAYATSQFIIDASGEKAATIFPLPKAGSIHAIGFRVETSTSPQTLRVGLYTVDPATGDPTGTLFGGSAVGTLASPAAATAYTVVLGTDATVGAGDVGDLVAAVIQFDSSVGNVKLAAYTPIETPFRGAPYGDAFAGTWTKQPVLLPLWIEYSDGTYADIFIAPCSAQSVHTYNSGTAGSDEYGTAFTPSVTMRALGLWMIGSTSAGADLEALLYNNTTALATSVYDGDVVFVNTAISQGLFPFLFESPITVTAGTQYISAIRPTTANSVSVRYVDFLTSAAMASWGGSGMFQMSRLNQGAWTASSLRRPMIGLLVDGVDTTGGSGETFTGSRLNRGFN